MTNHRTNCHSLLTLSIGTMLATLGSIRFLDEPIAVAVMRILSSHRALHSATANLPDTLLYLVCIGTSSMWLAYFYLARRQGSDRLLSFLRLAATALPFSYPIKAFLQFAFGRTNTRLWLLNGMPLRFDWFHGSGIGCFPSGHMAVFAAFGAAVWYEYPFYRRFVVSGLVLLAAALIVTDYHFLSDVIAGTYLGFLVTGIIRCLLKRRIPVPWVTQ
ncbi:phosphatase PAP2 family protein [Geobacter grbiciae]|uniref:phosphatase PAP2 family protein n=1 Tax=Geobacter grbiciae TaxID=155042 RepID=UPI001C033DFC|nr:phosphatase PAP2 family protein [Geobacter grbiciae]MBT1074215.1 phosphatase PAP2 family protein [Geobacter grbiciae]